MKEKLIKDVAEKLKLEEQVVEKIIRHQFDSANSAMLLNNSVEISGFGKFLFNSKKAEKQMESYKKIQSFYIASLEQELTEKQRSRLEIKLHSINTAIRQLKPKIKCQD